MKKALYLALLLALPAARAEFDRAQLLGRWNCSLNGEGPTLQDVFSSANVNGVSEYRDDGTLSEAGQLQMQLAGGEGLRLSYKYESQGKWELGANNELSETTTAFELKRVHETATRERLAGDAESRALEEEIFTSLQESLAEPEPSRSTILELDKSSLRLYTDGFTGSCTRL